jgi:hypothetical protein
LASMRALAVHYLVVGKRENKMLRRRRTSCEKVSLCVVLARSGNRGSSGKVVQRVVHEAHIPFEGKAEAALGEAGRVTFGKAGGLLRRGHGARISLRHARPRSDRAGSPRRHRLMLPPSRFGSPLAWSSCRNPDTAWRTDGVAAGYRRCGKFSKEAAARNPSMRNALYVWAWHS